MAWQEVFPLNESHRDAEEERELRLASQARAGAEWALSALVARYQPPVTRYLTRLSGDPEASRVLAERIFVRMEKRLRGPQGGHHLRLWLLRACTETGLDTLRHPQRTRTALRLDGPRMAGLLPERAGEVAAGTLRAGLGALANLTGTTSRQVRQLIWSDAPAPPPREAKPIRSRETSRANAKRQSPAPRMTPRMAPLAVEEDPAQQDPREALRYRMVRAVLAEIPYGDAQCLALHLIAGLNQAEVAQALGITHSATRRRIVQGLQLFAQRYEAAAASLGLSMEALAPGAASTTPPMRATTPPRIAQTPPVVAATTIPLPQAALEDAGPDPFEQQPMAAWDRPFEVTPRASAPPVEAVASVPPPPEPVTIDAVAAPDHFDPFASDEVDALWLVEHAVPAVTPDEGTTPVVVETTAVVDAVPVAQLPLEDAHILSAPEAGMGDDMVALGFAPVEVPARPPEPGLEPESERVSAEETLPEAQPEARPADEWVALVAAMASSAPRPARVVPVLTRPLDTPVEDDALAPSATPVAHEATPEMPSLHWTQPALGVRIVPVLTPAADAEPESPPLDAPPDALNAPIEHAGNGAARMNAAGTRAEAGTAGDADDAARETVVLAAGAPEGAPVEAQ